MAEQNDMVICNPVRTAIGSFSGTLKNVPASDLGAAVIRESVARSGIDPAKVGSVVMGNVIQAGAGMNPARQAAINGGIPVEAPALTVNRVCGSGLQSIAQAVQEIRAGDAEVVIAGGMENMDQAPYLLMKARSGYRLGHGEILDSMLRDGLHDAFTNEHAGWHTEDLVEKYGISREEQDEWAVRSHQRFSAAQAAGHFQQEIVPFEVTERKKTIVFDTDEHNRPDANLEGLQKLRGAFRKDGTITAGNAPGINSGAAAMVVCSADTAAALGMTPVARIVSTGVAGVEPGMFGIGPVPASQRCLARAGWSVADVQRWEINEAFAAITLAVIKDLGLSQDVVNVEGGAIAHGHAIGATGAVLMTRIIHSMRRDQLTRGVVTMCIGGGQGVAAAIELL